DALGRELVLLGAIGGAFYGIMIMMALYNLVLYLSIKDRAYLYYVFAIASFVMVMVFVDGLPWVWGWFDDPDWYNKGVPISTLFTWFWLLAFSRKYLQTREHAPFADKVVMFLMIAALWCSIMSMYADYHISIIVCTQVTILFAILLFCIGVREWRLGNQQARYYTLAWVAYMMGVLMYILHVYGVLERSLVTSIGVQLGAFSNVLLLSLALADRINMQKRETERAKQRALQSKQEAVEANRRATEHLKRFKQLYDNAAEGIFQCSLDGRFLSANPSLALTFGYESPAALIEGVENIAAQCYVDPQDRFAFEQRLQERRRVSGVESRYKRRDGSTFWGSSSAHMVFDAQGKPAYIEGSLIDITERTEKE
ncbi:MAG: PAS domain S-box protein, partial [Gammaproteobacteria bacterium]|nr:PAS domain S-box protein [Gammaproteobacteria bacterium]